MGSGTVVITYPGDGGLERGLEADLDGGGELPQVPAAPDLPAGSFPIRIFSSLKKIEERPRTRGARAS